MKRFDNYLDANPMTLLGLIVFILILLLGVWDVLIYSGENGGYLAIAGSLVLFVISIVGIIVQLRKHPDRWQ